MNYGVYKVSYLTSVSRLPLCKSSVQEGQSDLAIMLQQKNKNK